MVCLMCLICVSNISPVSIYTGVYILKINPPLLAQYGTFKGALE